MKNTLTVILTELKVKYTHQFANALYKETPNRENFFGIACMLSAYGIESKGYFFEEKKLEDVQVPFVAQTYSGFTIVTSTNNNYVICADEKGRRTIPLKLFLDTWTGYALVVEKRADSKEIDYSTHKKSEIINRIKASALYASLAILMIFGAISRFPLLTDAMSAYLVLCLLGIGVSWLLINRQWHSGSPIGNKICDFFSKGGCETVSNSPASRALFGISWSEFGVGYFLSTLIIFVLFPNTYHALGIINCFTLPFTLWSLWYQVFKVKKLCPLCLAVLIILWGLFIVFCFSDYTLYAFTSRYLLAIPFYGITILSTHFYSSKIEKIFRQEGIINSYRSILCRKEVLLSLQKDSSLIIVNDDDSSILMGNPVANNQMTIISNPFCGPCAHVHKVLEQVLKINGDIQVRYVFVSHNDKTHSASRYLIGSYRRYGEAALNEWFNMTAQDRSKLMKLVNEMEYDVEAENELQHHKAFYERNSIKQTPTVIINGHIAPSLFTIEDLAYTLFE